MEKCPSIVVNMFGKRGLDEKKYNIIVSMLSMILGAAMIFFVRHFEFKSFDNIGPGFWPRLLGILIMILSGILLLQTVVKKEDGKAIDFGTIGMKRVFLMILIMVVFSVLLYFLGMILAMIFFNSINNCRAWGIQ